MKKLFTLMMMCVLAITAQAKITIYVQCETAPYVWTWGAAGGTFDNVGDWPGTLQMTEKYQHPDTGDTFWKYSFPDEITQISFLLNNGNPDATIQTDDVKDVTSDRYFTLSWTDIQENGHGTLVDVTEEYVEIPDAEVTSLGVSGNHVGWDNVPTVFAEVVETGKTFKYTFNVADFDLEALGKTVLFKFRPNGASWLGYWDVYYDANNEPVEGKTSNAEAPEWLEFTSDGNFKIDFNKWSATSFTFTMTFNGGKSLSNNWTLQAEAADLKKLDYTPTDNTWTVAGEAALCGTEWDPANTENDMVKGNDGIFRLTRTNVVLEAATYKFKVCANHGWNESYGDGNNDKTITIDAAGTYDVTFTFNEETKEVAATAAISTGINEVQLNQAATAVIYNLQGQRVDAGYRGVAIQNGRKVVMK